MKICMFTNTYLPHVGGVANSVASFAEDLRGLGHRVMVVAPRFDGEDDGAEAEEEVLRLPAIQQFNGSDFAVRMPLPFLVADRMSAFAPDIVHSHHPFLLGDSALRTARQRGIPLVFTHHTLYERYTHYVRPDAEALRQFAVHLSTEYANLCTRVVAPSGSIADLIRERGVRTPVEVIPTGVDLAFFAAGDGGRFRRTHGIPPDAVVVGHVGRLATEKNLAYLARGVSGFLEARDAARFLVVGEGPAASDIRTILEERKLGDRLVMPGSLTGEALRDGYHAMDLFAFSSLSETQGMVLVEAMAAGLPVVALDGPGVREVLQSGRNGILLPAEADPERFAGALGEWGVPPADGPDARRDVRSSVRGFERRACARRLGDLYGKAVGDHRSGAKGRMDTGPLDRLTERIRAEWNLVESKLAAAVQGIAGGPDET